MRSIVRIKQSEISFNPAPLQFRWLQLTMKCKMWNFSLSHWRAQINGWVLCNHRVQHRHEKVYARNITAYLQRTHTASQRRRGYGKCFQFFGVHWTLRFMWMWASMFLFLSCFFVSRKQCERERKYLSEFARQKFFLCARKKRRKIWMRKAVRKVSSWREKFEKSSAADYISSQQSSLNAIVVSTE